MRLKRFFAAVLTAALLASLAALPAGAAASSFSDVGDQTTAVNADILRLMGVVSGTGSNRFDPGGVLTRAQFCTMAVNFLQKGNEARRYATQTIFSDVTSTHWARAYINYAASYTVGGSGEDASGVRLISGVGDGRFLPNRNITMGEAVTILLRALGYSGKDAGAVWPQGYMDLGASIGLTKGLSAGAYDSLYENYVDIPFTVLVPQGPAVDLSFFDRAVFIGDSVSLTLESYCKANGALGGAKFLCAGSMSASNMLSGIILPEYPKGSGQKPAIEESVAACGADVVYVMLGMDNIAYGVDRATGDMVKILTNITERNPEAQIIIQSVTPMADSSTSYSDKLNNNLINAYNQRMQELCEEHRWYYLNVAEVFKDENGCLIKDYCSDYGKMGMHFTYAGAEIWVNYLKTHVPEALLGR